MPIAEFNIGVLKYDWGDPRLADFEDNLDRIYALAQRSPGYIWHMDGDEMEAAQLDPTGPLGGNPRTASTLSVWEDYASLRHFTFHTIHRHFVDRGGEWHLPKHGPNLVLWPIAEGHRPDVPEAAARLAYLSAHGPAHEAFDWAYGEAHFSAVSQDHA